MWNFLNFEILLTILTFGDGFHKYNKFVLVTKSIKILI